MLKLQNSMNARKAAIRRKLLEKMMKALHLHDPRPLVLDSGPMTYNASNPHDIINPRDLSTRQDPEVGNQRAQCLTAQELRASSDIHTSSYLDMVMT